MSELSNIANNNNKSSNNNNSSNFSVSNKTQVSSKISEPVQSWLDSCKNKNRFELLEQDEDCSVNSDLEIASINSVQNWNLPRNEGKRSHLYTVEIGNKSYEALVDSGAEFSYVSKNFINKISEFCRVGNCSKFPVELSCNVGKRVIVTQKAKITFKTLCGRDIFWAI